MRDLFAVVASVRRAMVMVGDIACAEQSGGIDQVGRASSAWTG